ncbi:NACHT domain-containing protein [Streptomyces sp. Go40/10]|uniref:NACHT domain-containing protein n=1 Tax=Streptomyces sp. Go40/10 TaxID=2825844 RepID=UPI001E5EA223|nr:NACHT domain-containing protein [Streptomyces sp. Go40/10]UFQ99937.1 NACHT domain-containing protein [Streptomyces sp. Go40/10]
MGIRYLLLVVSGAVGALALAWHFHLGTAATAVTVLLGLAPAYIAWAAFRADRAEAASVDLDTVAEQLAVAVKTQWDDEVAVRRVNDPYPLPVAWRPADADLGESWPLLTSMARAWPGGPPGDPALWPQDAAGLAGADAQIGEVYTDRVPTRRLVILGEPGSGKSVLLIRLLQDLIQRRTPTSPVPVLFSLASWDPGQPLKAWMAELLRRSYPGLTSPAPTQVISTTAATAADRSDDLAQALVHTGRILPLLDGFDELPSEWHTIALDALNRALSAQQPLVLASRTVPYRDALTRPGTALLLNGAAAIQLLPLAPAAAAAYLRRDAGGPHSPAAGRWDAVTADLGSASPVGQALSTPLGLFLARTIHNPRPRAAPVPAAAHPDQLCDTTAFPDRAALDAHLFNGFIPSAYTADHPRPPRWTAAQAHRTFVFLAQFLHHQRGGSPDLAWWELPLAIPAHIRILMIRLMVGLVVGLAGGLAVGLAAGPMTGLAAGPVTGLAAGVMAGHKAGHESNTAAPSTRFRWSRRRGLAAGLVTGLVTGLTFGFVLGLTGLMDGLVSGLTVGLGFGLLGWLGGGLRGEKPDLTSITGPVALLISDRRTFRTIAGTAGLTFGAVFGLVSWPLGWLVNVSAVGLVFTDDYTDEPSGWALFGSVLGTVIVPAVVTGAGLGFGIALGLRQTAWAYFVMARIYLAVRYKVPWHLMAFLQDAHEHRGLLRQVGPVYQFRHIDLQRHLAQQQPGHLP